MSVRATAAGVVVLVALAGCMSSADPEPVTVAPTAAVSPAATPTTGRPTPTPTPVPAAAPTGQPTEAGAPTSGPAPGSPEPASSSPQPARTGAFDVTAAAEASGLVAGRRDPAVLWILDDGPGTTSLLAVDRTGATLGVVEMAAVVGTDTEDLAAGPCGVDDPSPCLYVGDIGDNTGQRGSVQVHRFPEPAPDAGTVEVVTATLTHPGQPTDAEGLVVTDAGLPVILTKEEGVTRLLAASAFADGELVELATLTLPEPRQPLLTSFAGLSVTSADLSPSGTRLLLRTYDTVVELTAPPSHRELAGVAAWAAAELPAPFEGQGEAVAYLPDGRGYATVGEGSGDIWVVER